MPAGWLTRAEVLRPPPSHHRPDAGPRPASPAPPPGGQADAAWAP